MRGNVPPLEIVFSNISYTNAASMGVSYATSIVTSQGKTITVGNPSPFTSAGTFGYESVQGNQPNGVFDLTYTCESYSVPVDITVSNMGYTVTVTTPGISFSLYQFLRIGTTYHQIVGLTSPTVANLGGVGYTSPFFQTAASIMLFYPGGPNGDAEYGVFYSDPTDVNGVSEPCYQQRKYPTSSISPIDTALDIQTKIRALSGVISEVTGSISVQRTYYASNASHVGYSWTITFYRQNGNINPLICDHAQLVGTNTAGGAVCTVKTITDGTLIAGTFKLGMSSPHQYEGTPSAQNATIVPWNIDANSLQQNLEVKAGFGTVAVSRVAYTPTGEPLFRIFCITTMSYLLFHTCFTGQLRWSGGYLWTVSFVSRNGQLPPMSVSSNITAHTHSAHLYIGTQKYKLPYDDPGTAVIGNQVSGQFGMTIVDQFNVKYNTSQSFFPVVSPTTGQALSAAEFLGYLTTMFNGQSIVTVTRSGSPNKVMGYTYSVTFVGSNVGGRMMLFQPDTTKLGATAIASTANKVGALCTNPAQCQIGSYVVTTDVQVNEAVIGAQLQGTFQLRFNGYTTGPLAYNSDPSVVARALNNLVSIAPSQVTVSRDGPMITPSTQVFGYVWSITFTSNTWKDPTTDHSEFTAGNWQGSKTTWADVWPTGYSKAWGKNVGNMPLMTCISSTLYVSDGVLPASGCLVEEVVAGTPPLSGSFSLGLNTIGHPVINIQKSLWTGPIAHNAFGNATESNGDGSSLQEILEQLWNVGEISVTRSTVNVNNGGYTWFVTFLRDGSHPGGQFGNDCQQRDDFYQLCNSPGNVPSLTYNQGNLEGMCRSNLPYYNCSLVTIMTGDDFHGEEPPGSKAVQQIFINNPNYDSNFYLRSFNISYIDFNNVTQYHSHCLPINSTAQHLQYAITSTFKSLKNGVLVTGGTDTVHARNGKTFTIYYFDEGYKNLIHVEPCQGYYDTEKWTITSTVVVPGAVYGLTARQAGVVNGVVQRGAFNSLYISGSTVGVTSLPWNSPAEGKTSFTNTSIKSYIEATSGGHQVNVSREVIGKYGVVEYTIRFVYNPNEFPTGAGDIPLLVATQAAATNGVVYHPQVFELAKGSQGISGYFTVDLHDPNGPRNVTFNETAYRLLRKLDEFSTIGSVYVAKYEYPNNRSGGWGAVHVPDGTMGGYEWRVYFLNNPGSYNGRTFPPGSGNIDPLTVSYVSGVTLNGTNVLAETVVYKDGSIPIDGTFTLTYNGSMTAPITYDQAAVEMQYLLQDSGTIGEVSTSSNFRFMQQVDGVLVSALRDSQTLSVTYTNPDPDTPPDVRFVLNPGDLFRVGGASESADSSSALTSVDGAEFFGDAQVAPQSPILDFTGSDVPLVLPGESVRIGADSYTVVKTGEEVQVVSVDCGAAGAWGACGNFQLTMTRLNGVTGTTACIGRPVNADMTTASQLKSYFDALVGVAYNDVVVTRTASLTNNSYVFSIYFEGPSVIGDVRQLIVKPGCVATSTNLFTSTTVTATTAAQGGFTAVQSVRVNVEAGYIVGGMYKLQFKNPANAALTNATANCIPYGASASAMQDELQGVSALTDQLLPFTVSTTSSSSVLVASSSVFGILEVGSIVNIPSPSAQYLTVTKINSGLKFEVSPAVNKPFNTGSLQIYLYQENSVQVARYGTGNTTATVITVTSTADQYISSASKGFFRLRMAYNGTDALTTSCLSFNTTAQQLQTAINLLGFDFNGDGTHSVLDYDHVTVTRSGDGSVTWGYGYVYTVTFGGTHI